MPKTLPTSLSTLLIRVGFVAVGIGWVAWAAIYTTIIESRGDSLPLGTPAVITGVLTGATITVLCLFVDRKVEALRELKLEESAALNLRVDLLNERLDQILSQVSRANAPRPGAWLGEPTQLMPRVVSVPVQGRATIVPVARVSEKVTVDGGGRQQPRRRGRKPGGGQPSDAAEMSPKYMDDVAKAVALGRQLEAERLRRGEGDNGAEAATS